MLTSKLGVLLQEGVESKNMYVLINDDNERKIMK